VGAAEKKIRAVLDTNVVLSALVLDSPAMAGLREAWQQRAFLPVVNQPVVQELIAVLTYPKFGLKESEIDELLADYLPYCEEFHGATHGVKGAPSCRDVKDQVFLNLAQAAGVEVLVTGDSDLLALAGKARFAIETPREFKARLGAKGM
jgi:putative PIN family toxin of toxin-antitoxin system